MRIPRRLIVLIIIFVFVVGLGYLLTFKYPVSVITKKISDIFENSPSRSNTDVSQDTTFAPYVNDEYVMDPDLGAVPGTAQRNETALEFQRWNNKYWVTKEVTEESLDELYDRFIVTSVTNDKVSAVMIKSNEPKDLILGCLPGDTALFKDFNMQFVSSGFNASSAIKAGDQLYTKCVSELCEQTVSKCIIIRSER